MQQNRCCACRAKGCKIEAQPRRKVYAAQSKSGPGNEIVDKTLPPVTPHEQNAATEPTKALNCGKWPVVRGTMAGMMERMDYGALYKWRCGVVVTL